MHLRCFCKSHDLDSTRTIYDLHEMDPEHGETALQVYVASYKVLPPDDSFALFRKAQRLDRLLPPVTTSGVAKSCAQCGVDVSPKWHQVIASQDRMQIDGEEHKPRRIDLCHLCWFEHEESVSVADQ